MPWRWGSATRPVAGPAGTLHTSRTVSARRPANVPTLPSNEEARRVVKAVADHAPRRLSRSAGPAIPAPVYRQREVARQTRHFEGRHGHGSGRADGTVNRPFSKPMPAPENIRHSRSTIVCSPEQLAGCRSEKNECRQAGEGCAPRVGANPRGERLRRDAGWVARVMGGARGPYLATG